MEPNDAQPPLTDEQRQALTWIRDNQHHIFEREAAIVELTGDSAVIRIGILVYESIRPYLCTTKAVDGSRIFDLTDAGHAALAV